MKNIWDYDTKPLTDLLEAIVDNRGKTVPTTETGRILIATNCVTNNTLFPVYEKVRFISDETYETWFRAHPIPGDIIFVNKGTPGKVCMVPDPIEFCIAQDMIALRANDKKIYNKYLFAVLRSERIQKQIYNTNVGDVIPHFKKQFLDQLLIPIPPREIQEFIGNLYYQLSYKIELNKQINDNLEQQLQALYNEWFVENPKSDWHSVNLSEIATFVSGYSYKGNELVENSDTAMATIKNFERNGGFKIDGYKPIIPSPKLKVDQRAQLFDILVAHTDLTQNAEVIGNAEILLSKDIYKDLIFSMDLVKVNAKESFPFQFLLALLLKNPRFKSHCIGYVNGTTVLHMNKRALPDYETIIPNLEDAQNLNATAKAIFCQMSENLTEISNLTEMRDTLLPRLMSGELKINDLDS